MNHLTRGKSTTEEEIFYISIAKETRFLLDESKMKLMNLSPITDSQVDRHRSCDSFVNLMSKSISRIFLICNF